MGMRKEGGESKLPAKKIEEAANYNEEDEDEIQRRGN